MLERLPDRLAETGAAALSLAVIRDGELAEARAWGLADVERAALATDATLFQAGSISKPVSCFAVLRLVARGDLDLDWDVNEYLTSWQVPQVDGWQPRLTLRRLMSHTAGTTVHGFPGYDRGGPIPTVEQILDGAPPANTPAVRVDVVPGSMWRYSGGGTTIVQLVLEDSTRTAFPELLQELVLEPAGMVTATFEQPLPEARQPEAAIGYYEPGKPVPGGWHVYPEVAAAGLGARRTTSAGSRSLTRRRWTGGMARCSHRSWRGRRFDQCRPAVTDWDRWCTSTASPTAAVTRAFSRS